MAGKVLRKPEKEGKEKEVEQKKPNVFRRIGTLISKHPLTAVHGTLLLTSASLMARAHMINDSEAHLNASGAFLLSMIAAPCMAAEEAGMMNPENMKPSRADTVITRTLMTLGTLGGCAMIFAGIPEGMYVGAVSLVSGIAYKQVKSILTSAISITKKVGRLGGAALGITGFMTLASIGEPFVNKFLQDMGLHLSQMQSNVVLIGTGLTALVGGIAVWLASQNGNELQKNEKQ